MASVGSRGLLKVKTESKPRKMLPWQAYYALTYQSRWKPHVDKLYKDYCWEYEEKYGKTGSVDKGGNPNIDQDGANDEVDTANLIDKPQCPAQKTWFQIMSEFMRQKFNKETKEMQQECKQLRTDILNLKEAQREILQAAAERNDNYQLYSILSQLIEMYAYRSFDTGQ